MTAAGTRWGASATRGGSHGSGDKGRVFTTDLIQALELQCLVENLPETIVVGALAREEAAAARHYRSGFPHAQR